MQLNPSQELSLFELENLIPPGALDGFTIMRYAHISRQRTSGGIEQYLRQLDRGLLLRHRLTVVQMHVTKGDANHPIDIENVGLGRILWVPVPVRQTESRLADLPGRVGQIYTRALRQHRRGGTQPYRALLSSVPTVLRHRCGHLRHKTVILSDHLAHILDQYSVDLLAVHWMSYDTHALLSHALRSKVPYVLINHFDNSHFSLPWMLRWIHRAAAIGAVSGQQIPNDFGKPYTNLSDAVDTEFFSREKSRPLPPPPSPIILLPARIERAKGHRDALKALQILKTRGIDLTLCFAGSVDSQSLSQELRDYAIATGLEDSLRFLGEKTAEELRDWYAASKLVILPSYSEGLSRIILETQAMKTPVIAYDSGGTREAMLPDVTGFLIRTGSVEALADKIQFVLTHQAESMRLGERGRAFVSQRFSISKLIQRHEVFYLNALARR